MKLNEEQSLKLYDFLFVFFLQWEWGSENKICQKII
jgi:hypothetical protein